MDITMLKGNLKKELWEYNKIFFWLPSLIVLFSLMLPLSFLLIADISSIPWLSHFKNLAVGGVETPYVTHFMSMLSALLILFVSVMLLVQVYYFNSCLFDERRDLSIMFWRSMPVSDNIAVLSKLFTGMAIIPFSFLTGGTLAVFAFLAMTIVASAILSLGFDISLWHIYSELSIFNGLASFWINTLLLTMWLFPLYAWLMLTSLYAKKAPFLWAVLPFVVILTLEAMAKNFFGFPDAHLIQIVGQYFGFPSGTKEQLMSSSAQLMTLPLDVLSSKVSIGGVILGTLLVVSTCWLRKKQNLLQ
jgi:ABC-2 type transport system permease protein